MENMSCITQCLHGVASELVELELLLQILLKDRSNIYGMLFRSNEIGVKHNN